ncbi:hypothetical protein [Enterococcus villorum]|uniref:Uncharacterized protein n=2 Tax=Enterococcus villorum TaxID=112904 RepID=A0A511J5C0_9ENTE|nr:hypothetical protein [Enterococcus villorum]EOH88763.1 hypothetical protein UAO_01867 [Enterococcus villorum ATCC 700913]EOW76400.1 hypothetical protein I591_01703 [Enterococcus villorum ATCC 700913]GEL93216.1 hypothetical protein EVI01_25530 [Enterococcus villorum]
MTIIYFFRQLKYAKIKKNVKMIEDNLVRKNYPNLSTNDLNYRRVTLANYQRFYFTENSRKIKLKMISSLGVFITVGALISWVVSKNTIGIGLCLVLFDFFLAILYLSTPNTKKERTFWENYLNEHPDNSLMILLPLIDERAILYKESKKMAIYSILLGIVTLSFTSVLFITWWLNTIYFIFEPLTPRITNIIG